jgi:hypothetical protein
MAAAKRPHAAPAAVMSRAVCALLCVGCLAAHAFAQEQASHPGRPGREVSLPAAEVKDTFFGYILGVIRSGAELEMNNRELRDILVEFKSHADLPFDLISLVTQREDPATARRRIGLVFQRDVVIPIPFSILFYHPGSIVSSRDISFDVRRSLWADPDASSPPADVFDLALTEGTILVDIDDWLEALFSSNLEDTWIQHIVFFRWHGAWVGMLEGTGRYTGKVKRAYFDFTANAILFPPPESLKNAGKTFVPGGNG